MVSERENLLVRKEILSAYLKVLERPEDLVRVCASVTGDSEDLRTAVIVAFGVSEMAADAILALQVRRFTPLAVKQMREEMSDYEHRLLEIAQA